MNMLVVGNGWILEDQGKAFVGRRTREFLENLSGSFDMTYYLCSSPPRSPDGHSAAPIDGERIRPVPVPIRGASRVSRMLSHVARLGLLWKTIRKADFVYMFFPGHIPVLCATIARLLHKPYGVYLRGELGKHSWWWRRSMAGATFVIAHGGVLADAARPFCKDVELAIPLCPLLTDDASPRKPARREGPWRLLYVGILQARKGIPELLEAAAELQRRGLDVRLDLVGQDDLPPMPECVDTLGDRVHFAGVVRDNERLKQYYRDADLFCFPSHNEGFPRVLYEAMTYGTPIVTTFVGSIPSLMQHEVNCLRVDVESPAQLADAIERALKDPDLRERFSANGRVTMDPIIRRMKEETHEQQVARKVLAHSSCASASTPPSSTPPKQEQP